MWPARTRAQPFASPSRPTLCLCRGSPVGIPREPPWFAFATWGMPPPRRSATPPGVPAEKNPDIAILVALLENSEEITNQALSENTEFSQHSLRATIEKIIATATDASCAAELQIEKRGVIVFDRPGFGHSNRPRRTIWTPEAQADFLHEALERIGVSRATVLGHSWGASGSYDGAEYLASLGRWC